MAAQVAAEQNAQKVPPAVGAGDAADAASKAQHTDTTAAAAAELGGEPAAAAVDGASPGQLHPYTVDISPAVREFSRILRDWEFFDPQTMEVAFQQFRRAQLPEHINRPQANRTPEPDGEAGAVEDGGEAAPPPPVATGKKTWASLVANSK